VFAEYRVQLLAAHGVGERILPSLAIDWAASMKPPHAARAIAPPTLMRRTPKAAASATRRAESAPINRLKGFGACGERPLLADSRRWVASVRAG